VTTRRSGSNLLSSRNSGLCNRNESIPDMRNLINLFLASDQKEITGLVVQKGACCTPRMIETPARAFPYTSPAQQETKARFAQYRPYDISSFQPCEKAPFILQLHVKLIVSRASKLEKVLLVGIIFVILFYFPLPLSYTTMSANTSSSQGVSDGEIDRTTYGEIFQLDKHEQSCSAEDRIRRTISSILGISRTGKDRLRAV